MIGAAYGELEAANEYLDDHEALEAVFRRRGYLFFCGVLNTDEVGGLMSGLVRELRAQGFLRPDGAGDALDG